MKYVLTKEAKEFVRSVVKSPSRAQEIIEKTEFIFNSEQKSAGFTLGELRLNGWPSACATIRLERHYCAKEVEDLAMTEDEIDGIGAEEAKKDNE